MGSMENVLATLGSGSMDANAAHCLVCVCAPPAGEKPKKKEVLNVVVPKIAHEWKYIAVQLEIEEVADQINLDYQKVKEKCFHVIVAWLEGKGHSDITWNALLKAMEAQGFHDFAEELKQKLARGEELC